MQLFKNNAASALAVGLSSSATTLTVQSGTGALFPAITGDDYFLATLYQRSGNAELNHEVVKVTARAGDVFTITRAYEGTAKAFNINDPVELRITAKTLDETVFKVTATVPTSDVGPIYLIGTGPAEWDATAAAYVPKSGGAKGGGANKVFYPNDKVISEDMTLTADQNWHSVGPLVIEADVIVEGDWVIS